MNQINLRTEFSDRLTLSAPMSIADITGLLRAFQIQELPLNNIRIFELVSARGNDGMNRLLTLKPLDDPTHIVRKGDGDLVARVDVYPLPLHDTEVRVHTVEGFSMSRHNREQHYKTRGRPFGQRLFSVTADPLLISKLRSANVASANSQVQEAVVEIGELYLEYTRVLHPQFVESTQGLSGLGHSFTKLKYAADDPPFDPDAPGVCTPPNRSGSHYRQFAVSVSTGEEMRDSIQRLNIFVCTISGDSIWLEECPAGKQKGTQAIGPRNSALAGYSQAAGEWKNPEQIAQSFSRRPLRERRLQDIRTSTETALQGL